MYQKNTSKPWVGLKRSKFLRHLGLVCISALGFIALPAQAMQENPKINQNQGLFRRLLGYFVWQSEPTLEALIAAVAGGEVQQLKDLINQGLDVNSKDNEGDTPLHVAAALGQVAAMEVLLEHGADVNAPNKNGDTALHVAARKGHAEVINLLLEHGANLDAYKNGGNTPLCEAVWSGHAEAVNLLLKHRASPDALSNTRFKPLFIATLKDQLQVMKMLLTHGASLNVLDKTFGHTPLYAAVRLGYADAINLLLEREVDVNAPNKNGDTPLHMAARKGYADAINLLLEREVDVNAPNKNGNTPLHVAAWLGDSETIDELLEHGANLDAQNNHGDTPLHVAVKNEQIQSMIVLLKHGADLEVPNKAGETLLDLAMQNPQTKKLFTEDINRPLPSGLTLLGIAAKHANTNLIKFLVRWGAELGAKDANGFTAMDHAIEGEHTEAVRCLLGLNGNKGLLSAIAEDNQELVELFLSRDADINARNAEGYSPLLLALKHGHIGLATELIRKGADPKAMNKQGETALHLVSSLGQEEQDGQEEMMEYLLENGANVFLLDHEGRLAIHRAAEIILEEDYPFMLLIKKMKEVMKVTSADKILSMTDKQGNTVLHIAARTGNVRLLALCREEPTQNFEALLRINNALGQTPYAVAIAYAHHTFAAQAWLPDLEAQPDGSQQQPIPTPSAHVASNSRVEPNRHNAQQRRAGPSATPTPTHTPPIAYSVGNWNYRQLGNTNSSVYDLAPHKHWSQEGALNSKGDDDSDNDNGSALNELGSYLVGAAGQAASALLMYGGAKNKALGQ